MTKIEHKLLNSFSIPFDLASILTIKSLYINHNLIATFKLLIFHTIQYILINRI